MPMIKAISPHLFFDGRAEEAITFYKEALGAQVSGIMRWGEMPDPTAVRPEDKNKVMHSRLTLGHAAILVADHVSGTPHPASGNGTQVLELEDPAEVGPCFDRLAAGGTAEMPVHDAFWGAKFGILVDRFGVRWMLHSELQPRRTRMVFPNLAVRDLERTKTFFGALGFRFDARFTNEQGACMELNDQSYVMFLTEPFFKTFTKREPCDTSKTTELLLAIACDSKAEVDRLVKQALESGGAPAMPPQDQGFMYGWSFYDPDGHHWEVFWMDPKAVPPA